MSDRIIFRIHAQPHLRSGRPLLFMGGLIGAWIFARIIFLLAQPSQISIEEFVPKAIATNEEKAKSAQLLVIADAQEIKGNEDHESFLSFVDTGDFSPAIAAPNRGGSGFIPNDLYPLLFVDAVRESSALLARKKIATGQPAISGKWGFLTKPNDIRRDSNGVSSGQTDISRSSLGSRLSVYGYIFGRSGNGSANALGARYGGSQAALQAAYSINDNIGWDAVVRVQTALNSDDKELAAGVRVRPLRAVPISVIAEHRFRPSNADGLAFYAAGGKSAIPLPIDFKLNIYGQAGLSTAGPDTLFFDAQAVAERPIHTSGNVTVSAGGGAWAGGQSDAQRLDIGPSLSVTLSSGNQNYRLSGDWRERVSGNAAPDSGVAITLSTDF